MWIQSIFTSHVFKWVFSWCGDSRLSLCYWKLDVTSIERDGSYAAMIRFLIILLMPCFPFQYKTNTAIVQHCLTPVGCILKYIGYLVHNECQHTLRYKCNWILPFETSNTVTTSIYYEMMLDINPHRGNRKAKYLQRWWIILLCLFFLRPFTPHQSLDKKWYRPGPWPAIILPISGQDTIVILSAASSDFICTNCQFKFYNESDIAR